jgi:hypothetical protein
VLEDFSDFLARVPLRKRKIWGNGASFDNAILAELYRVAKHPSPWEYWNDRCYRTLKNLYKQVVPPPERKGTHHNALDDAVFQAEHAVSILKFRRGDASRQTLAAAMNKIRRKHDIDDPFIAGLEGPSQGAVKKSPYKRKF